MAESKAGNKGLSIALLVIGAAMMGYALVLDFSGSSAAFRGPLLVVGAVAILAGLYYFPTIEHHRSIINFIFLFPLLFTFTVTVIIPMALGIGYSFTDWNGVKVSNFVGLSNYTSMFQDPAFIWSIVLTFLFVVVNMILVNVIGFLLALLCSTKIKGVDFYRASYFLPNLIGGIVLGYIWQQRFNQADRQRLWYEKFSAVEFQDRVYRHHHRLHLAVRRLHHAHLHHRSFHRAERCA